MGNAFATETIAMTNCSIEGCGGKYEQKLVTHTVRNNRRIVVIDHVPADVCDVCGDVLFTPETVHHIEHLLANQPSPSKTAPVFEYA